MDVRDSIHFSDTQHCTNNDCYTFSHTAKYCGKDQPRFCECAFDYREGLAADLNAGIIPAEDVDVRDHDQFSDTQHCTNNDCYTFSHTAQWCGNQQPRFCECPFDYEEGFAVNANLNLMSGLYNI